MQNRGLVINCPPEFAHDKYHKEFLSSDFPLDLTSELTWDTVKTFRDGRFYSWVQSTYEHITFSTNSTQGIII